MPAFSSPHGLQSLAVYPPGITPKHEGYFGPEYRYRQWCRRARWFTLAAFNYELYLRDISTQGLKPITFEAYCEIRSKWEPIPRDPFTPPRPIAIHETYGAGPLADAHRFFAEPAQGGSTERNDGPTSNAWASRGNPAGLGLVHHEEFSRPKMAPGCRWTRDDYVDMVAGMKYETFRVRAKWFTELAFYRSLIEMGHPEPSRFFPRGTPPKDPFRPNPIDDWAIALANAGASIYPHAELYLGDPEVVRGLL